MCLFYILSLYFNFNIILYYREKEQLQQDIMVKKETLAKGKEEVVTMQGDYEETSKLNQQLEQQRKELQGNIDEITLQVRRKREGGRKKERGKEGVREGWREGRLRESELNKSYILLCDF